MDVIGCAFPNTGKTRQKDPSELSLPPSICPVTTIFVTINVLVLQKHLDIKGTDWTDKICREWYQWI
jgi:hypothetical protein